MAKRFGSDIFVGVLGIGGVGFRHRSCWSSCISYGLPMSNMAFWFWFLGLIGCSPFLCSYMECYKVLQGLSVLQFVSLLERLRGDGASVLFLP